MILSRLGVIGTPPLGGGVPSPPREPTGAEVMQLARLVGRLSPRWNDPERYFEERDELEKALRKVARRIEAHRG